MREETADEWVRLMRTALESVKPMVSKFADEAGARTDEEREAIVQGLKLAPQNKLIGEGKEPVELRTGWGEPDWEGMKKLFLSCPEPSPEETEAALRRMKSLPHIVRRGFQNTAKHLPHDPGGHPRALSPEEELAACQKIEEYRIQHHMDASKAIARVARESNKMGRQVHAKTLRRYYKNYLKGRRCVGGK